MWNRDPIIQCGQNTFEKLGTVNSQSTPLSNASQSTCETLQNLQQNE
jgi:hypothetical protein